VEGEAMFRNREDAAYQLARKLKGRELLDPLVLAIPRGGVVTGGVLASELGAELDVVLSRKLRAPEQPELAVGAVSEDGHVYLSRHAQEVLELTEDYLAEERRHQLAEIARRKKTVPRGPAPGPSCRPLGDCDRRRHRDGRHHDRRVASGEDAKAA